MSIGALDGPIVCAVAVTPNDTANNCANYTFNFCRGLYIGGTGSVKVNMAVPGQQNTFTNAVFAAVQGGTILPIRANQVYNTGTTATNILALY